jgi:eukaryotic-like serine/threonine-protein kinase
MRGRREAKSMATKKARCLDLGPKEVPAVRRWLVGAILSLGCASSDAPSPTPAGAQDAGASPRARATAQADDAAPKSRDAAAAVAAKQGPCPPEMVYVPPGTFMMGKEKDDPIAPLHKVTLTKAYCIDKLEVTLEEYQRCEKARVCTKSGAPKPGYDSGGPTCNEKREGRNKHPINCITWLQADAYCRWRKKHLPTEAEWEFAARGPESFKWPWGNQPPTEELAWNSMYMAVNKDHAKCADMGPEICPKIYKHSAWGTTEVGKHPDGASPFGALDMGGNVGEWVQDWDMPMPGQNRGDAVDPTGPTTGKYRVIKDIGWDGGDPKYTVGDRSGGRPDKTVHHTVGMRCALSPAS